MKKCLWLFLMLASASAYAGMYKWTDAQGNVQYSDKPPPAGVQSQTMAETPGSSTSAAPASSAAPAADENDSNLPDGSTLTGLNQYTRAAYEKYRSLGGSRAFFICQDGSVSTIKAPTDEIVDKAIKKQQDGLAARGCRLFARNNQLAQ